MAYNNNSWEGFDGSQIVYDDAKEKKYQRTIWLVLAVIAGLIFISLLVKHTNEFSMKTKGNYIDAEYYEYNQHHLARYCDQDGVIHNYELDSYTPVLDGETVRLYYKENIDKAVPANTWYYWTRYYIFFGVMLGISLWRLIRIYHPVKHS